ncbi:MAG TPA: adenosylhomocysteinase [bacterium]|nr:adenosylhomocysteinase [bacterium]
MAEFEIRDRGLVDEGVNRVEWAGREMPVLLSIRERFAQSHPFAGLRLGGCLHVTSETANLALALQAGGAEVFLCASNPLSTNDAVAAALAVKYGIHVHAVRGEDRDAYYRHLEAVLSARPSVLLDDGADLISQARRRDEAFCREVFGGTEETTTGVIRFRNLAREGRLRFPIVAVNEADTKHLFDNRYGTGQSTIDGLLRATNLLLAGRKVVVAGYGWCSRGIAQRARGLGAIVAVTEIEPVRALEALMDGFLVMPSLEAARFGDVFITATGNRSIFRAEHFRVMKSGAILANSGHFDVEIDIPALAGLSRARRLIRDQVEEFELSDGRRLYLLAQGRLLNLAAAEGHPSAVMDMSFANQALSAEHLVKNRGRIKPGLYPVPEEIDREVARLKLAASGVEIDRLTPDQEKYLSSWQEGT